MCRSNERACHDQEGYELYFFYVYITLFRDLGIRLPFSEFQMGVLRRLNICPAQLHPNGWVLMQAFNVLYTDLLLTPTPASFLYFFLTLPNTNRSWVSLISVKDKQSFTSFNSSYKDFKSNFCKIPIREPGRPKYYFDDGRPRFPFYWTENPNRVDSWAKSDMTENELDVISQIDLLPRKTSSRKLIDLLETDTLCARVFCKFFPCSIR